MDIKYIQNKNKVKQKKQNLWIALLKLKLQKVD